MELTAKERKTKRDMIGYFKENLTNRGGWHQPFIDTVDRYMGMWATRISLQRDIKKRGVQIETERGPKKNDSVALLVSINKQMDLTLSKLGIDPPAPIKGDDGADV